MPVAQLSLWDNAALESGYRSMSHLELDEAVRNLNEALLSAFCDQETTRNSLAACNFWQPRIKKIKEIEALAITNLLSDYSRFSFTRLMTGLKKALLSYLVECLSYEPNMNVSDMETAFDLLMNIDDFQVAENMVSKYINRYPENYSLLYFLAQAQWRNGNKAAATKNYTSALLYYPEKLFLPRIENNKLQELIHSYGLEKAPAYGWIMSVLPFVHIINNIEKRDETHAQAISSYRLLQEAHKSAENNDIVSGINYRKQLKTENPELYQAYFNLLKERKRN